MPVIISTRIILQNKARSDIITAERFINDNAHDGGAK